MDPEQQQLALRLRLKQILVRICDLSSVTPDQIGDHDALFTGTGALQLTSLDTLELAVAIEHEFGFKMENVSSVRECFQSVARLAEYVLRKADPEKLRRVLDAAAEAGP